jgi:hypothetical protein
MIGTAFELKTTSTLSQVSPSELQDFLARPVHWPEIVLSSNQVMSTDGNTAAVEQPLTRSSSSIKEYFGLNFLSVEWVCTQNVPGEKLIVESQDGLKGIAKDCVMDFDIRKGDYNGSSVTLTMNYTPESPLAIAATPVLMADNWIALNVLLPMALRRKKMKQQSI